MSDRLGRDGVRTGLRRVAASMAAVALLGACGEGSHAGEEHSAGPAVSVEELVAAHGDAVWRVETDGCGWVGVGSAFAIDPNHLVTNHHVIANDTSPSLRASSGEVRAGRVIGADRQLDVAVIELDEPVPSTLGWARTSSLEVDEPLVLLGYPRPEHVFTASFGSLLRFGGTSHPREVLLSNAPVDRGSSGGPALRGDGSVAGVVTRAVLDDPTENVAIVHTTDRVIGAIERAIAAPAEVLSDCGLGPDYVPPVPPELEVTEVPPPPAPPEEVEVPTTEATVPGSVPLEAVPAAPLPTLPQPSATLPVASSVPAPTTSAPSCPSGAVDVATVAPVVSGEAESQRVTARGVITNHGSAPVVIDAIEVTFAGAAPVSVRTVVEPASLDPGAAGAWEASAEVVGSPDPAPMPRIRVAARWAGPAGDRCAPPAVTGG